MSILDKPNYGELTRQAVLAELALNNPRSVVYPVDRVFNIVQIETTWGTKPKAGDVAAVADTEHPAIDDLTIILILVHYSQDSAIGHADIVRPRLSQLFGDSVMNPTAVHLIANIEIRFH